MWIGKNRQNFGIGICLRQDKTSCIIKGAVYLNDQGLICPLIIQFYKHQSFEYTNKRTQKNKKVKLSTGTKIIMQINHD